MAQPKRIYSAGTLLRHHAGSTWEVLSLDVNANYTIKCIVGTVRPGWIGGDREGTVRHGIHGEYLHGDGWKPESQFSEPSSRATPNGLADVALAAQERGGGEDDREWWITNREVSPGRMRWLVVGNGSDGDYGEEVRVVPKSRLLAARERIGEAERLREAIREHLLGEWRTTDLAELVGADVPDYELPLFVALDANPREGGEA